MHCAYPKKDAPPTTSFPGSAWERLALHTTSFPGSAWERAAAPAPPASGPAAASRQAESEARPQCVPRRSLGTMKEHAPHATSFPGSAWERPALHTTSFPGSAWERAATPARPACSAAAAPRRQVEPEARPQCVPRRSLGTMKSPSYHLVPRLCLGTASPSYYLPRSQALPGNELHPRLRRRPDPQPPRGRSTCRLGHSAFPGGAWERGRKSVALSGYSSG